MNYTIEDFKNARFAEHPRTGELAFRTEKNIIFPWETVDGIRGNDEGLSGGGWVPVPDKPHITDSEVGDIAEHKTDDWLDGFITGYQKAGGTILDETPRERVARLITETLSETGVASLPEKAADRLINLGLVKENTK